MSVFKPGDKVRFQHQNPDVDDQANGVVGVVTPFKDDFDKEFTEFLFGVGAVEVKMPHHDPDDPEDVGIALPEELTLVEN